MRLAMSAARLAAPAARAALAPRRVVSVCRGVAPVAWKQALRALATEAAAGAQFLDAAETAERVMAVMKTFEKVDKTKLNAKSHFMKDLGLDSLDAVEIVIALEEEFSITIPDPEADALHSVEDAVRFISTHPMAK